MHFISSRTAPNAIKEEALRLDVYYYDSFVGRVKSMVMLTCMQQ